MPVSPHLIANNDGALPWEDVDSALPTRPTLLNGKRTRAW
jgi:hypothetical protein